jgi:transcriptional regulator with XRE-family HTH domain
VGAHLFTLRHQRGLSQERLAELAGVDRRTVGSWERGDTAPTLDDLTALAGALRVESWMLLFKS